MKPDDPSKPDPLAHLRFVLDAKPTDKELFKEQVSRVYDEGKAIHAHLFSEAKKVGEQNPPTFHRSRSQIMTEAVTDIVQHCNEVTFAALLVLYTVDHPAYAKEVRHNIQEHMPEGTEWNHEAGVIAFLDWLVQFQGVVGEFANRFGLPKLNSID